MRPIPFAPVMEKLVLTEENYGSVRRFFVETTEDNAIPLSLQQSMCANSPPEKVLRLKGSDHAPFFSRPQALHKTLVEIATLPPAAKASWELFFVKNVSGQRGCHDCSHGCRCIFWGWEHGWDDEARCTVIQDAGCCHGVCSRAGALNFTHTRLDDHSFPVSTDMLFDWHTCNSTTSRMRKNERKFCELISFFFCGCVLLECFFF